MGIIDYIKREKEKFQEYKAAKTVVDERRRTEQMTKELSRQAKLAEVTRERVDVQSQLQKEKDYIKSHEKPSMLKAFGAGLVKTIQEQKGKNIVKEKASHKAGRLSGLQRAAGSNSGGLNFGLARNPFMETGSGMKTESRNPFSLGSTKEKPKTLKKPQKTIIIKL